MQTRPNKSKGMSEEPVQGFYTIAEAAAVAKCCSMTIHRAIKSGKLSSLQPGGPNSNHLIPQGNLVEYLYGGAEK